MNVKLLFLSLISCGTMFSQVGIGTTNPKATFEITGKSSDDQVVDGIIIPKLTGNELKAKDGIYGADQIGTMLYVTAAASPTTAKTANVTAAGYYYYDGSVWLKSNSNLQVGYKTVAAVYPTTPSKGDIVFTTSDGTTAGTKYRIETYDGTNWVNDKGVYSYIVTLAYAAGDIVTKDGLLYESNAAIPANTAFAIGITGTTWKTLTGTAEYGSVYPTNNSSISSATIADLAGATLNLPSAGVYRVYYNISTTGTQDGGHCIIAITDSSNVVYNGSSSSSTKIYGGSIASIATQELTITVNAPKTIKLRWNTNGAGTSTLVNNTNYSSVFGYEKIAGFLPVTNNTPLTFTETTTISATTTAPTKANTRNQDYITLTDDGTGWCEVEMVYAHEINTGTGSGSGTYLFSLPAGYTFNTTTHPLNTQLTILSGNAEIYKGIAAPGIIEVNGIASFSNYVVPHTTTQFKIMAMAPTAWGLIHSGYYTITGTTNTIKVRFRFKKA